MRERSAVWKSAYFQKNMVAYKSVAVLIWIGPELGGMTTATVGCTPKLKRWLMKNSPPKNTAGIIVVLLPPPPEIITVEVVAPSPQNGAMRAIWGKIFTNTPAPIVVLVFST